MNEPLKESQLGPTSSQRRSCTFPGAPEIKMFDGGQERATQGLLPQAHYSLPFYSLWTAHSAWKQFGKVVGHVQRLSSFIIQLSDRSLGSC